MTSASLLVGGSRTDSSASSSPSGEAERSRGCAVDGPPSSPSDADVEISDRVGEGARAGILLKLAGCFVRKPGGGLCGDDGGFETLPPPRDEDGDGERSGAADDACRRDGVEAAAAAALPEAEVPTAAAGSTYFLRGIVADEPTVNCRGEVLVGDS